MTEADRAIECFVIIDNAKSVRSLKQGGDINDNVIIFFTKCLELSKPSSSKCLLNTQLWRIVKLNFEKNWSQKKLCEKVS